jgi:hypothetical protein
MENTAAAGISAHRHNAAVNGIGKIRFGVNILVSSGDDTVPVFPEKARGLPFPKQC